MKACRIFVFLFYTAIIAAVAAGGAAVPASADDAPVLTLELAIVHGKVSTPRDKREVSRASLEVPLDGKERDIRLRTPIAYSTTSAAGTEVQFVDGSLPAIMITGTKAPGGAEFKVYASYLVPVPVPEAFSTVASAAVSPKTALRGFVVSTRVALPAEKGASAELGSVEDPAADRAWDATITVTGARGTAPDGALQRNRIFVARVEESDGKTAAVTTLRVASLGGHEARIEDKFSVPYAATSSVGTMAQFIDFPVQLMITTDPKGPGAKARVIAARQHGRADEPWSSYETEVETTLTPGVRADMSSVSEGSRTMRATIEEIGGR